MHSHSHCANFKSEISVRHDRSSEERYLIQREALREGIWRKGDNHPRSEVSAKAFESLKNGV